MVMLMARAIGAHTLATGTDIGEEATARQRRLAEITYDNQKKNAQEGDATLDCS